MGEYEIKISNFRVNPISTAFSVNINHINSTFSKQIIGDISDITLFKI